VRVVRQLLAVAGALLLCTCQFPDEGTEPADCEDGADNDADGAYDCDDDGCAEAPVCLGFRPGMIEDIPICDAGDEAFVRRLLPQLWGRHARTVRELDLMVQIIEQSDRATLVRAMMDTPLFAVRWAEVLKDILQVNRVGERSGMLCGVFVPGEDEHGSLFSELGPGGLAAVVRDSSPEEPSTLDSWTLHDLIIAAIELEDISPVFRVHLFAQLGSKIINLDNPGANLSWRGVYGDMFSTSYLNRNMACVSCHNSEYSATDSSDADLDRTWQLPGYLEKALFGNSGGRPAQDLAAFFRVEGVLSMEFTPEGEFGVYYTYGDGFHPWGLAARCGSFILPDDIEVDPEEWTGYFIEEVNDRPSIWHMERWLRNGFDKLRGGSLAIADDSSVDGEEALVWMVSMSVAEKVWTEVMGRPLTVAHDFPRNRYQRDLLQYLSEVFVEDSYSLQSLVEAVVLHPYFNPGMPDQCEGIESPYYLAPVFDPWVSGHQDPGLRLNHPGDLLERLPPRLLTTALVEAMEWPEININNFTENFDAPIDHPETVAFEIDLGVFLIDGEAGFRSSNFSAGMAWEEAVSGCVNPFPREEDVGPDWIDRLLVEAPPDASLEDLSLALKDRLLGSPVLTDEVERELVEALLQHPLDTPLSQVEDAALSLRRLCSALLSSPDFMLSGIAADPMIGTDLVLIPSGSSSQELCQELGDLLFDPDEVGCDESGAIELSLP